MRDPVPVVPRLVAAVAVARVELDSAKRTVARQSKLIDRAKAADAMARRAKKRADAATMAAEAERERFKRDAPSAKQEARCNALVCEVAGLKATLKAEAAARCEETELAMTVLAAIGGVGYVARHRLLKAAGLEMLQPASGEKRKLSRIPGMDLVLAGCERTVFMVPVPENWNPEEQRKSNLARLAEEKELADARWAAILGRRDAMLARTKGIEATEAAARDSREAAEEARQNAVNLDRLREKTKKMDAKAAFKVEADRIMEQAKAQVAAMAKSMGF
jgi:hypothetical protein